MQLATPIIHLEKNGSTHHIHVITWFDSTKFRAEGYDTLLTTAISGEFEITLYVAEDIAVPEMQLLTPVIHTLTLTGITLSELDPIINIKVYNTTDDSVVSSRKVHKESAGSSAM